MHRVTILIKWNMIKVVEGKQKQSRLVWYGPGVEFYVCGEMKGGLWGQAANLAMNYAENMHIAPSSIKTIRRGYGKPQTESNSMTDNGLKTKRMF